MSFSLNSSQTYKVDHLAGAEAITQPHPALVLSVLSPDQDILVAHEVGPFIHHPSPTLHADGVAAAQVSVEIQTVTVTLITSTLEVLVLKKDDLEHKRESVSTLWVFYLKKV